MAGRVLPRGARLCNRVAEKAVPRCVAASHVRAARVVHARRRPPHPSPPPPPALPPPVRLSIQTPKRARAHEDEEGHNVARQQRRGCVPVIIGVAKNPGLTWLSTSTSLSVCPSAESDLWLSNSYFRGRRYFIASRAFLLHLLSIRSVTRQRH